jgi:hypothetical protein
LPVAAETVMTTTLPLDLSANEPTVQATEASMHSAPDAAASAEPAAIQETGPATAESEVAAAEPSAVYDTQPEAQEAVSTPAASSEQSAPQSAEFVIPASVLVGMDESFIAPVRPSSLAASVAEAVHAAALEAALESSAAQAVAPVVQTPAIVVETPAPVAVEAPAAPEQPRERRRAPNDPRNRLPQQ